MLTRALILTGSQEPAARSATAASAALSNHEAYLTGRSGPRSMVAAWFIMGVSLNLWGELVVAYALAIVEPVRQRQTRTETEGPNYTTECCALAKI